MEPESGSLVCMKLIATAGDGVGLVSVLYEYDTDIAGSARFLKLTSSSRSKSGNTMLYEYD